LFVFFAIRNKKVLMGIKHHHGTRLHGYVTLISPDQASGSLVDTQQRKAFGNNGRVTRGGAG
jgi:hypothetical protein